MTIALVSSANDDKRRKSPGRSVTLCLYNPTDDTILLGDPDLRPTGRAFPYPTFMTLKTTSKFNLLIAMPRRDGWQPGCMTDDTTDCTGEFINLPIFHVGVDRGYCLVLADKL